MGEKKIDESDEAYRLIKKQSEKPVKKDRSEPLFPPEVLKQHQKTDEKVKKRKSGNLIKNDD